MVPTLKSSGCREAVCVGPDDGLRPAPDRGMPPEPKARLRAHTQQEAHHSRRNCLKEDLD